MDGAVRRGRGGGGRDRGRGEEWAETEGDMGRDKSGPMIEAWGASGGHKCKKRPQKKTCGYYLGEEKKGKNEPKTT